MPATPPDIWLSRETFEKTASPGDRRRPIPKAVHDAVVRALHIDAFYRDNQDKAADMILPKEMPEILHQMGKSAVFTCEIRAGFSRHIVASSILWEKKMLRLDAAGRPIDMDQFYEVGTQQSIMGGYGFQWILNVFTLLSALTLDPDPTYFAATFGDNDVSMGNFLRKMHFAEWSPLPDTWKCERESALRGINQLHRGVAWFRPTLRTVQAAADLVVELINNPVRERRGEVAAGTPEMLAAPSIRFHCEEQLLRLVSQAVHAINRRRPASYQALCDVLGYDIGPNFLQS